VSSKLKLAFVPRFWLANARLVKPRRPGSLSCAVTKSLNPSLRHRGGNQPDQQKEINGRATVKNQKKSLLNSLAPHFVSKAPAKKRAVVINCELMRAKQKSTKASF
jgi:hypothetical protein